MMAPVRFESFRFLSPFGAYGSGSHCSRLCVLDSIMVTSLQLTTPDPPPFFLRIGPEVRIPFHFATYSIEQGANSSGFALSSTHDIFLVSPASNSTKAHALFHSDRWSCVVSCIGCGSSCHGFFGLFGQDLSRFVNLHHPMFALQFLQRRAIFRNSSRAILSICNFAR